MKDAGGYSGVVLSIDCNQKHQRTSKNINSIDVKSNAQTEHNISTENKHHNP
jgi:hypothetical protein